MRSFLIITAILLAIMTLPVMAQRNGAICGDPTAKCRGRDQFQPWELSFAFKANIPIYESEYFYAAILKSVRLKDYSEECEKAISENERLEVQKLFPHNKAFALRCAEAGGIFYTNVADDVSFLGIYAGKTKAQADAFMKALKATGKYPGAILKRMKAGINGT